MLFVFMVGSEKKFNKIMKWNMSGSRSDSGVLGRAKKNYPALFLVSFSKIRRGTFLM